MDAFDLFRLVARFWRLAVVLILAVSGVVVGVGMSVPEQYTATSTVLTVRTSGEDAAVNPLAQTDPAYVQAATLVVSVLQSPGVSDRLVDDFDLVELVVTNESGPVRDRTAFVDVTVTGSTEEAATAGARAVSAEASRVLIDLQRDLGVPRDQQLTFVDVVIPDVAVAGRGAQLRAVALVAVLGLAVVVLVLVLVDRVLGGRAATERGDTLFRRSARPHKVHDPVLDALEGAPGLQRSPRPSEPKPGQTPRPLIDLHVPLNGSHDGRSRPDEHPSTVPRGEG